MTENSRYPVRLFFLFITSLILIPFHALCLSDFDRAQELFEKSFNEKDPAAVIDTLNQAVRVCPRHAGAWNNLGMAYEEKGDLDAADNAYKKANELRPDMGAPIAGLGDIAMRQGRFEEASRYYKEFLNILSEGREVGDPQGLGPYEEEYREKYKQAGLRWQIHKESISGVVTRGMLTRGFRSIRVKKKMSKPSGPEKISLCILFDFDSADLTEKGKRQLLEIAETMHVDEYSSNSFVIEGHTDLIGNPDYNMDLSRRRAESVRSFLISRGIDPDRLMTRPCGQSRPIVCYGGRIEQATNRRVEFIRNK